MSSKKINTKAFVAQVEQLTKQRMKDEGVVSLSEFRKVVSKDIPKNILVIDDDLSVRSVLQRILQSEGYNVLVSEDGAQLTEVLGESPIDLILLDIGLPWINGFEIAELMKQHEDLRRIPLIFISGSQSSEDVKMAFKVGADDFIRKPFQVESLKKAVNTLIQLHFG